MARFNIELSVTGAANTNKALSSVNREATSLEKGYQRLQSTIRDLSRQQGNLQTSMQRLNVAFKSGRISEAQFTKQSDKLSLELSDVGGKIQQAQSRLTSFSATMKQATDASRSFGTANKQLQGYSNDFTSGIRSSNAVAVEFSRIIQDAPYGIQGVANNLQQLTQNYAYYTRSVREAAAVQGRTVTTGALVRGALGSLLSPINLLTLGISAVTAGWVAYERWSQRSAKASREAVDEIQELIHGLNNLSTALYEGAKSSGAEIAELQVLYTTIRDGKQAYDTRINAVKQIQEQYPAYFKNLSQEQILTGQAAAAYRELRKDILSAAQAQAAYGRIGEKSAQQLAIDEANRELRAQLEIQRGIANERRKADAAAQFNQYGGNVFLTQQANSALSEQNNLQDEITENLLERAKLQEDINELINLGVSLQGAQVKEIENAGLASQKVADIISKLNDSLRSQQEESILSNLTGLDKTIQSIRFQYDALERAAVDYRQQTEDAFKQGNISAQQYQANLAAIEAYLQRIGRFEVGAVGRAIRPTISPVDTLRAQSTAGQLNTGAGQVVQRNIQQPYVAPKVDWSDFEKGLKRATTRFVRDFTQGLDSIAKDANYKIGGILAGLGTNIVSSMLPVFQNFFGNKLETLLTSSFGNISSKFGEETSKTIQNLTAGIGVLGSAISQLSSPKSAAGQGVGGALSGAATGLTVGASIGSGFPIIGTIVGGLIGAIAGIFGANRRRKLEEEMLAEQKKQTALMERQAALAFTSQIIGQQTSQGIVTGVGRNEFGDLTFRIQGRDLVAVFGKEEAANLRGV